MTQITEYKPLEDEDSEYDVSSCPKKTITTQLIFYVDTGQCYIGKIGFLPHYSIYLYPENNKFSRKYR